MSGLSHLDELEAEAIYIIREVAAECEKPVMLYSIGKDSSDYGLATFVYHLTSDSALLSKELHREEQ
jgi:3'-phosphoadenosine 5'-phosphosulfate sulfotransferase (PAPS reductase)/FAD synthetase